MYTERQVTKPVATAGSTGTRLPAVTPTSSRQKSGKTHISSECPRCRGKSQASKLPKLKTASKSKLHTAEALNNTIAAASNLSKIVIEVPPPSKAIRSNDENPAVSTIEPSMPISSNEPIESTCGDESLTGEQSAATAAATALKKERGNGTVRLIYEMYNEEFTIVEGSMTQQEIDEVYALSFVMPDCHVHLSTLDPIAKRQADITGMLDIFVKEDPVGTYQGLEKECNYYVYVEQEAAHLARDHEIGRQQAERRRQAATSNALLAIERDDGRGVESCSCIYGNPCVDEYGCRDWSHRFAIASANGWKGF